MSDRAPVLRVLAGVVAAFTLLVAIPDGAPAQARELYWPEVTVQARLDADGRLHVRERQVMRLTGDWNGGERIFTRRAGQTLTLHSLLRLAPSGSEATPLERGDLDRVDRYDWTDRNTLRWRSRMPSDPPFDETDLVYVLEFTYDNILQPRDDGTYLLDHDFAFADREGVFSRFDLELEIDSAWRVPGPFDSRRTAINLPPGQGYVVTALLERVAAGRPASVRWGADPSVRQALLAVLVVGLVGLFIRLVARERRLGRMAPLPDEREITPDWLREHVFSHLPEVVGAAWDEQTGAPEVAATLARMVRERKLSSGVKTKKVLFFETHVLHLQLLVRRESLHQHERALVDGLFRPGEDTTDTERVRERYQKTGFDPASVIRARLTQLVDATSPGGKGEKPSRVPTIVMLAAAIALVAAGVVRRPADGAAAAGTMMASLPVYLVAIAFASAWRQRVSALWSGALGFLIPLAAMAAAFAILALIQDRFRLGPIVLAGLVVWLLALANSVFNVGRTRQSAERIARRKRLAAAREYFDAELRNPQPQLKDEWFPYVLAFGLNRQADRWFRRFGGESVAGRTAAYSAGARSGGVSGGGGGSWSGFGGSGGFGGAGGGAAFGAAIGGMAASVPKPGSSSSGGGGGGGGGGSSGGGGGGGW
ncbi:MAG TPA: hypothetical protein VK922_10085 [Gemmatimonadaceae bacterium]|nr:hypothetical protein [Gemmatimonadaceae bacterium]